LSTWQPFVPEDLRTIARQVEQGERPTATVRTLLSWFWGSRRRGNFIVTSIRLALKELGLRTEPDFNYTYLDGQVEFIQASVPEPKPTEVPSQGSELTVLPTDAGHMADAVTTAVTAQFDPTFRIGRLELANRPPSSVHPEAEIIDAATIMLMNNYSQLPVIVHERQVMGLFSWRSLGSRLSQGTDCKLVRDAMDDCEVIDASASLFDAVEKLKFNDCLVIRGSEGKISGIMTAYDISVTFGQLGEPFLILGEIENHVRSLIAGKFSREELSTARDAADASRPVNDVSDLTFGEYVRLLENPANWQKLNLQIARALFVKKLEEIRVIRNDVMHFDPEGIEESDLKKLRDFVAFLQRLQRLKTEPKSSIQGNAKGRA
jgi:predicted transcriptional regulator